MQTWARRGVQTALVTGGLLMLGTSIASADENVSPDRPASPIDGGATVPLHVGDNAVGTPVGQVRPPSVDRAVGTDDLTGGPPRAISTPAAGVPGTGGGSSALRSNRARTDVVVPVDVSGNAIAAGGDTSVVNRSDQDAGRGGPVLAGWEQGPLTGNVIGAHHAAPVQVTGNAVGLVGDATSRNDATQSATTGDNTTTTGARRTLGGNVLAEQGATPVQVNGNAIAGAGGAHTRSTTASTATSDGTIGTDGAGGTGSGNVAAVPLAVPVGVSDQAVSGVGNADSDGRNTVVARGGDSTLPTRHGRAYVATDGDPATLSGNAIVPGVAGPAALTCNAAGIAGNTDARCASTDTNRAGGVVDTSGAGSTGSGNLAVLPVSEPAEVFGNGATAAGNAHSRADNTQDSKALGNSYSVGDRSVLSGDEVTAPVAGANDVYANGVSGLGNATGTGDNDVRSASGGYTGTTGNGGTAAGNIWQAPVAAPLEAFGTATTVGGTSAGTVPDETKEIRAGGPPNARDDDGTMSSNVVTTPAALPAQAFGDTIGVVGDTRSAVDNHDTVFAGGPATATGRSGTGSGNVAALPAAVPAQAFDDGLSVVGNGSTTGINDTTAVSGGAATADGRGGTVAGDVVHAPIAGPVQAFGVAAASPGNEEADSLNNTYTTAGDDTVTSGDRGSLAGDAVTPQLTQVAQVFGVGLAGGGNSTADGFNNTSTRSGGDVRTSGEWGALSGDLVDVPATDVTQTPADGAAVAGNQQALARSTTSAVSGGSSTTSGAGVPVAAPVGAPATVFRVPVDVLGSAIESGQQSTYVNDGDRTIEDAPPVGVLQSQRGLGPSDAVERQLRVDQVPAIADLFRVPNLRGGPPGGPVGLLDQTQIFPSIVDGLTGHQMTPQAEQELTQRLPVISGGLPLSAMETTQRIPVVPGTRVPDGRPALHPGTGRHMAAHSLPDTQPMPVIRSVPTPRTGPIRPGYRPVTGEPIRAVPDHRVGGWQPSSLPSLPDLPPVPTLPAMPPLPDPNQPTRQAGRPAPRFQQPQSQQPQSQAQQPPSLFTPHLPSVTMSDMRTPPLADDGTPRTQDMPAGSAAQLMAQLRGLISELDTGQAEPPLR
jgi:hypothetical protein